MTATLTRSGSATKLRRQGPRKKNRLTAARKAAIVAVLIVLWELCTRIFDVNPRLMPKASEVAATFVSHLADGQLFTFAWGHTEDTSPRAADRRAPRGDPQRHRGDRAGRA